MVVENQDIGACAPRGRQPLLRLGRATTIYSQNELAAATELLHRVGAGAVSFVYAVRHVIHSVQPDAAEPGDEERGGACPVDVIVPENGDAFAFADCVREAFCRRFHVFHAEGVRGQFPEIGVEILGHLLDLNPAHGEDAGQGMR